MFDFLKGGKANLQVTLDRPQAIYAPGETIHVTVNVQGVKDLKIQGAKIALVSVEEYEYRYESRDSDGDTSTTKSKTTEERPAWQNQFMGEATIKGNSNQNFEFSIPIPGDALPTVDGGKILNYSWAVKTTLDRRLAGDVEDKREVYLPAKGKGEMGGGGEFGFSNEPGDAEISLRIPGKEFAVGDTIKGELVVRPKKQFDVTEIRVELARRESVPRDEGNEFNESQPVKLASGTKLTPGQDLVLPFQLNISSSVPISCRTPHGSIVWTLRGVLARRMRGDTLAEQELVLVSGS